jgi:hypothetical protein
MLRVLRDRVLRGMFALEKQQVIISYRKLHNEALRNEIQNGQNELSD